MGAPHGLSSMTGFGAGRAEADGLRVEVEARSVNHRHLKLQLRLPEELGALGPRLEELVRDRLGRGTVSLEVRLQRDAGGGGWQLDAALLRRFYRQLQAEARELRAEPPQIGQVALLPGVVRQEEADEELEAAWPLVAAAAQDAVRALAAMRRVEGDAIARDLRGLAAGLRQGADEVQARIPAALAEQAERLRTRVAQLMGEATLAPGDLAREIALLADRGDVAEELQRLRSHVAQLDAALEAAGEPVGRKLEFLAQELHRETNTMGAKAQDADVVAVVLRMKLLVERIREQVANVE